MLKIWHAPGTRSLRVIWLCEELGITYQIERVDFSARYRASPEFRALNPVGKVPVLAIDDFTMFESGAMVQHILDWHRPNGARAGARRRASTRSICSGAGSRRRPSRARSERW